MTITDNESMTFVDTSAPGVDVNSPDFLKAFLDQIDFCFDRKIPIDLEIGDITIAQCVALGEKYDLHIVDHKIFLSKKFDRAYPGERML